MVHRVPVLCVPSARGSESPHANVAVDVLLGVCLLEGAAECAEHAKIASDKANTMAACFMSKSIRRDDEELQCQGNNVGGSTAGSHPAFI